MDAPKRKDPPEDEPKPPAKKSKTCSSSYSKSSSSSSSKPKPGPRYRIERDCSPIRYNKAGKFIGSGSFWRRPFGAYSSKELTTLYT